MDDKQRVNFKIKDSAKALKCYKDFHENPYLFEGKIKAAIFLIKSEEIFVKYGDSEAKKFEE